MNCVDIIEQKYKKPSKWYNVIPKNDIKCNEFYNKSLNVIDNIDDNKSNNLLIYGSLFILFILLFKK